LLTRKKKNQSTWNRPGNLPETKKRHLKKNVNKGKSQMSGRRAGKVRVGWVKRRGVHEVEVAKRVQKKKTAARRVESNQQN